MKLETTSQSTFSSYLLEFKVPFTNKKLRLIAQSYSIPNDFVLGYSSRCKDGKYILLLDYDDLDFEDILEETRALQSLFKLSDFYFYKIPDRKNSFHAVCLDKMDLVQAYSILKKTSCDQAFINAIRLLKYREWVLRFGKKGKRKMPRFHFVALSKFQKKEKSLAHADFLAKFFSTPINWAGKFDKIKQIAIVRYNTANRVN